MSEMSLQEAQLFRVLGGFFGRDRVIWNMSVLTVCGGVYPQCATQRVEAIARWAGVAGCLFTIVDHNDLPKLVVEFAVNTADSIDLLLLERQSHLPELLKLCGVRYVVLTEREFQEVIDPQSSLDLVSLLGDRIGLTNEDNGAPDLEDDRVDN